MTEGLRIDKWLWAVRIFKTRNQASDACRAGKVKIEEITVKPSRELKINDVIEIRLGIVTKKVKVTGLIHNRVAAKFVTDHLIDMTPPEEYEKLKIQHEINHEFRPRGQGRPTKKERRLIERLKKSKF
jgi:ribosome-associated heat shock protein Hsp15